MTTILSTARKRLRSRKLALLLLLKVLPRDVVRYISQFDFSFLARVSFLAKRIPDYRYLRFHAFHCREWREHRLATGGMWTTHSMESQSYPYCNNSVYIYKCKDDQGILVRYLTVIGSEMIEYFTRKRRSPSHTEYLCEITVVCRATNRIMRQCLYPLP
jgi:hypothetical protein